MSDVLIRDVPDDVLAAVESHAAKLGLCRNEYLRRQLAQDAQRSTAKGPTCGGSPTPSAIWPSP